MGLARSVDPGRRERPSGASRLQRFLLQCRRDVGRRLRVSATAKVGILPAILCLALGAPAWGDGDASPRPGQRIQADAESWIPWYENNKADIEQLKAALYSRVVSEMLIAGPGKNISNRSKATHATLAKIKASILPALLRALSAKKLHPDVRAAAYVSLGKVADSPAHIEVLKRGLDRSRKHPQAVQASAALALGLLRRGRPTRQLPTADLDKVRALLFEVFENRNYGPRTRGFAMLALGLLGDQPSEGEGLSGHARTTARMFHLLEKHRTFAHPGLVIALLMSIGMQPSAAVTEFQRDVLRRCVVKGALYLGPVQGLTRSYAVQALGRVGNAGDIRALTRAMLAPNPDLDVQRSCAIALGQLGPLVHGEDRVTVARTLLAGTKQMKDASARNFAAISLADLIRSDIRHEKTDVIAKAGAAKYLLELARSGRHAERPFGALALGRIAGTIAKETTVATYGEFRARCLGVLRKGLAAKGLDDRSRAAFAVALGMAKDASSARSLAAIVADRSAGPEFRGYAALSLGMIGLSVRDVISPIRLALREHSSAALRVDAARALGLLKDSELLPLLLEELWTADDQRTKGEVVFCLAQVGKARAADPLVAILGDEREQTNTRTLAASGLGEIGDLEWLPSLSRIRLDVNYRAATDLIRAVLAPE